MVLIVGLGNPGKKFENTRHNVGFMAIDEFANKNNFPGFKLNKKYAAEISEGNFGGKTVLLAKPQTFMNESGKTVSKIISNFKFQIPNLVVIHDDIDLPVGKIKIVQERGSAGHKGVESIIENIGNKNLIRIRIGVAPQRTRALVHRCTAEKIVLKKISKNEKKIVSGAISKSAETLNCLLDEGLERAMNKYNG